MRFRIFFQLELASLRMCRGCTDWEVVYKQLLMCPMHVAQSLALRLRANYRPANMFRMDRVQRSATLASPPLLYRHPQHAH